MFSPPSNRKQVRSEQRKSRDDASNHFESTKRSKQNEENVKPKAHYSPVSSEESPKRLEKNNSVDDKKIVSKKAKKSKKSSRRNRSLSSSSSSSSSALRSLSSSSSSHSHHRKHRKPSKSKFVNFSYRLYVILKNNSQKPLYLNINLLHVHDHQVQKEKRNRRKIKLLKGKSIELF